MGREQEEGTAGPVAPFLVLDDVPAVRRGLLRMLRRWGLKGVEADCVACARRVLDEHEFVSGLLLDAYVHARCGDADEEPPDHPRGFAVLDHARRRWPGIERFLFSGDAKLTNTAARHGVYFAIKPFGAPDLAPFVRRNARRSRVYALQEDFVLNPARLTALTERHRQVLRASAARLDRKKGAAAIGCAPSTWDKHVRAILERTGAPTLPALLAALGRAGITP